MTRAERLLQKLYRACPGALTCNDMSHNKSDRHKLHEPCKPLERYEKALDDAASYLELIKERTRKCKTVS